MEDIDDPDLERGPAILGVNYPIGEMEQPDLSFEDFEKSWEQFGKKKMRKEN